MMALDSLVDVSPGHTHVQEFRCKLYLHGHQAKIDCEIFGKAHLEWEEPDW
jgi:hypothetical protein